MSDSAPSVPKAASEPPDKVFARFYKAVADAQANMVREFRQIQSLAPAVNKARMFQLANMLEGVADGRNKHYEQELRLEARWLRTVAESLR